MYGYCLGIYVHGTHENSDFCFKTKGNTQEQNRRSLSLCCKEFQVFLNTKRKVEH